MGKSGQDKADYGYIIFKKLKTITSRSQYTPTVKTIKSINIDLEEQLSKQ